jgi:hypothetical protein
MTLGFAPEGPRALKASGQADGRPSPDRILTTGHPEQTRPGSKRLTPNHHTDPLRGQPAVGPDLANMSRRPAQPIIYGLSEPCGGYGSHRYSGRPLPVRLAQKPEKPCRRFTQITLGT